MQKLKFAMHYNSNMKCMTTQIRDFSKEQCPAVCRTLLLCNKDHTAMADNSRQLADKPGLSTASNSGHSFATAQVLTD